MSATVFLSGTAELATLANTFSVAGVATDPTTVTLTITSPTGAYTASYTHAASQITHSSAGVYTKDIACAEAGIWKYVWTGTGTASDIQEGTWTVQGSDLAKLYCTVEELKSRFGGVSDANEDLEFRQVVDTVSRAIDEYCQRQFWRGSTTRTYQATHPYCMRVDDLVAVTALNTDPAGDGTFDTAWASSDYQLLPPNAATHAEARPYTEIRAVGSYTFPTCRSHLARDDRVQVAGVFGWPAVPAAVKQAALIMAADYYKLKDAPGGMHSFGDFAVRIRENSRAVLLLNPYRKHAVLVG